MRACRDNGLTVNPGQQPCCRSGSPQTAGARARPGNLSGPNPQGNNSFASRSALDGGPRDGHHGDRSFRFRGPVGPNAVVQIDVNHDRVADHSLILYNVASLVAADFVL